MLASSPALSSSSSLLLLLLFPPSSSKEEEEPLGAEHCSYNLQLITLAPSLLLPATAGVKRKRCGFTRSTRPGGDRSV